MAKSYVSYTEEIEVRRQLAYGRSPKQIARRMHLGKQSVKNMAQGHRRNEGPEDYPVSTRNVIGTLCMLFFAAICIAGACFEQTQP